MGMGPFLAAEKVLFWFLQRLYAFRRGYVNIFRRGYKNLAEAICNYCRGYMQFAEAIILDVENTCTLTNRVKWPKEGFIGP